MSVGSHKSDPIRQNKSEKVSDDPQSQHLDFPEHSQKNDNTSNIDLLSLKSSASK